MNIAYAVRFKSEIFSHTLLSFAKSGFCFDVFRVDAFEGTISDKSISGWRNGFTAEYWAFQVHGKAHTFRDTA